MLVKTHVISSIVLSELIFIPILISGLIPYNPIIVITFLTFLIFGSILPDIDEPNSTISKILPSFISSFINFIFGHRGFTHNIFGILIMPVIFTFLFSLYFENYYVIYVAILSGYTYHILGDLVTYAGIKSFWGFNEDISRLKFLGSFLVGSSKEVYIYTFLTIFQMILILSILVLDSSLLFL